MKTTDSSETAPPPCNSSAPTGKAMYSLFCGLSLYFLLAKGDYGSAASNLGIALIFDPFPDKSWAQRPSWQRAWLIFHLIVVFLLFGWAWMK